MNQRQNRSSAMYRLHQKAWRNKKLLVLLLVCFVTLLLVLVREDNQSNGQKFSSTSIDIGNGQRCQIPSLDPFDPEITPYINKPVFWEQCKNKRYGVMEGNKLRIKVQDVVAVYIFYINRIDDFTTRLSKEIHLFGERIAVTESMGKPCWKAMAESLLACVKPVNYGTGKDCDIMHPITQDFFKLMIIFPSEVHTEYHYAFSDKSKEYGIAKTAPEEQINVAVVLFDSLSHSHTVRSLKKTYKYLSEHPRTVMMRGHTINGDGTTPNLAAMLTGIPEKDQPEARRGFPNATFVDGWQFMFNDLHKKNYMTAFSEDDLKYGAFNYRLKGFSKPPATLYLRTLWNEMKDVVYNQISCPHQFHFRFLQDFFDANKEYNKFGFVINNIMHGRINRVENADDDTVNFLKEIENSVHGDNTVILFVGDHGLRVSGLRTTLTGKLEERLPLLSITYPPKLENYKVELDNLRKNSRLLTSHFDLYDTFQHLSTFPNINDKVHKHNYGRSLFTDITTLNRTCNDAGIDNHWCPCLKYKIVNASQDKHLNPLVESILEFINNRNEKTVPGKCWPLRLKTISRAGRRTASAEVTQFKNTKTDKGGCDSCKVEYDKSKSASKFVYDVTFVAYPDKIVDHEKSLPTFEAGGEVISTSWLFGMFGSTTNIKIDTAISRITLYGSQPDCIAAKYPHLREFCFCKDFKGFS